MAHFSHFAEKYELMILGEKFIRSKRIISCRFTFTQAKLRVFRMEFRANSLCQPRSQFNSSELLLSLLDVIRISTSIFVRSKGFFAQTVSAEQRNVGHHG